MDLGREKSDCSKGLGADGTSGRFTFATTIAGTTSFRIHLSETNKSEPTRND